MASQWYYAKRGQRYGPAASGQLQRAILLGLIVLGMICPLSKADDLRVVLGRQEVIMPAGHLGLTYFPDQPICVLNKAPLTFLMTVGNATFLLAGPSWRSATHNGKVLEPGGPGTFDNGYAGIGGVLKDGHTVYGFYHAEDHENKASPISERRGQIPGMFSIGLAISQDGGRRFRKVGQVLTSSRPYEAGKECGGVGDISVCLDKTNEYLLAFYADMARAQGKGVQICMARSPVAERGMPGTWRKYYSGGFDEPGLGGRESYVVSAHEKNADAYSPCAVYSKELDRYLLVFCWVDGSETDGVTYFKTAKTSGIYLATSRDGTKWEEPQQLFAHPTLLIRNSPGVQHPTLYLTGRKGLAVTGLLLYGYTPKWGSTIGGKFVPGIPHHLVGRTVTILPTDAHQTPGDKVTAGGDRRSSATTSSPRTPGMKPDSSNSLRTKLAGTKWLNSNNVMFEWTADGRFLHKGVERQWKVLDGRRVQVIFGPNHVDTLIFNSVDRVQAGYQWWPSVVARETPVRKRRPVRRAGALHLTVARFGASGRPLHPSGEDGLGEHLVDILG